MGQPEVASFLFAGAPTGPPGSCWFRSPSGCLSQEWSKDSWTRDAWGEEKYNASSDQNQCLIVRKNHTDTLCGASDTIMHFNPPVPSSSPSLQSPITREPTIPSPTTPSLTTHVTDDNTVANDLRTDVTVSDNAVANDSRNDETLEDTRRPEGRRNMSWGSFQRGALTVGGKGPHDDAVAHNASNDDAITHNASLRGATTSDARRRRRGSDDTVVMILVMTLARCCTIIYLSTW